MYQVLARKWRPQSFDEVVGQKHVTTTLANALKADRLAHAYIFAGLRGTGNDGRYVGLAGIRNVAGVMEVADVLEQTGIAVVLDEAGGRRAF